MPSASSTPPVHRSTELDRKILRRRGAKNRLDPWRPYAFFVEAEPAPEGPPGAVEEVATIFLTNRECPLRCLMCDLWKNTTDDPVPDGAIVEQIEWALSQMDEARQGHRASHLKLYNNGNFFDRGAIPASDHAAIARLADGFRTVIVENHPRLCGDECARFRDRLRGRLEIALGLETVHPEILPRLNKGMDVDDFRRAAEQLLAQDIRLRVFLLVGLPYLPRKAAVEWAVRSMEVAFDSGVACCSLVPTRAGNGMMDELEANGHFTPVRLAEMESALAAGLALGRGRVLIDLWDVECFSDCWRCGPARIERLRRMNLAQQLLPAVGCDCVASAHSS